MALLAGMAMQGGMSAPLWRGVDAIYVACALPAESCRMVDAEMRRDAPVPVEMLGTGDAAPDAIGAMVLTVRTVDSADGATLEIAAQRAASIDESQGALLPRRFAITDDFGATLRRALDRTLPWRSPRT